LGANFTGSWTTFSFFPLFVAGLFYADLPTSGCDDFEIGSFDLLEVSDNSEALYGDGALY
jgi:hypothetical protein